MTGGGEASPAEPGEAGVFTKVIASVSDPVSYGLARRLLKGSLGGKNLFTELGPVCKDNLE
jgi:hypothetical protein